MAEARPPWITPGFEPANVEECIYALGAAAAGIAIRADPEQAWRLAIELGARIRSGDFGEPPACGETE